MIMVINHFADRLASHAIVKGGMALRLADCPRFTNDLDYVFVPFSSKKDLRGIVVQTLREIPGISVTSSMNSKCLHCIVEYQNMKLQIEINAAMECPSIEMSTAPLARANQQQGRIIRVMRFDHALAHKLAAWNERRLMRDMYDIYFLSERLGAAPDIGVLKQRLSAAEVRVSGRASKVRMKVSDLSGKLNEFIETATQKKIEDELRDYLTVEEMAGLMFRFRASLKKLVEFLDRAG